MNINGLEILRGNWHSGLTQSNHLSTFYLTEPELASDVVTKIFNWQSDYASPLSFLTKGMGRTKELTNADYRWPLMGDDERAIPVVANLGDGGATPGIAQTTFRVKFAEKWFSEGDVLIPDNRDYPVRVMGEPTQDGPDWVYTLQLLTNDQTKYMPSALISAGAEFSKEYNIVERDHSRTSGDTTYATPFMLENTLTTLRKKYSVTGAAQSDVMVIRLMNPENGQTAETWVKYAEWMYMCQWQREIERVLWFGRSNKNANGTTNMKGASNNPIYSGAGVREQIAASNKRYYTKLTEKVIREYLIDLSYNVAPESSREFVMFTGEYGFLEFDRAMKDSASKFTLVDSKFVTGSGQSLTLGGQFVSYVGPNGIKLTLKKLPMYDNVVTERQLHPDTQRPVESYRFTILDFGVNGGESNIMRVHKKDREFVQWYVPGSCDPYGMKKNAMSASVVDGYEMHCLAELGIMIKNPTACGELILDAASL